MIVVRCPNCYIILETKDKDKEDIYTTETTDQDCSECKSKPITPEEKLLRAIFGEP